MPTYEYRCQACAADALEKLISWSATGSSSQSSTALYSKNPAAALEKPASIPPKK